MQSNLRIEGFIYVFLRKYRASLRKSLILIVRLRKQTRAHIQRVFDHNHRQSEPNVTKEICIINSKDLTNSCIWIQMEIS